MGWKLISKPTTSKATKTLAKHFCEMEPVPHDRPLSERRLQVYERILKSGSFRPCTWASAHCLETDETYRINGKHTSTLLSAQDEMPEFFVIVEEYECDTLEDVARLYGTFDSRLAMRTTHDINASFLASMPELASVSTRIGSLAVTGISYAAYQDSYGSIPAAERAEALLDNGDYVLWLNEIIHGGKNTEEAERLLKRGPVAASMFLSFRKSRRDADAFWVAVRDETSPDRDSPDRVLARFLRTYNVNTGGGATPGKKRAAPREIFVKCIHAWNAWRKQEATDLKYYAQSKIPTLV